MTNSEFMTFKCHFLTFFEQDWNVQLSLSFDSTADIFTV